MAKPTWTRTQLPGWTASSTSIMILTLRLTPLMSTVARWGCSGSSITICPGIARHMLGSFSERLLGQFPQHVVQGRLRLLDTMHRGGGHHEQVRDRRRLG